MSGSVNGPPDPVVSVVMPAFEAASTIEAAVASVLNQSLADLELFVVDDGSTDGTAAIVRGIADPRVRLLEQDHQGAAAARNLGVRAARAQIVTLVDSDDLLLPSYLAATREALLANPDAGFVYTDAYVLNADSGRIRRMTATQPYRPSPPPRTAEEFHAALIEVNFVYNAVSLPRSVFDRVGFFDESLRAAIDYEMWLRIAANGFTGVEVPGPLAVYRSGRRGSISSNRERVLKNLVRVFEIALERHPGSATARELVRARHEAVSAELEAVRGARALGALLRRGRDRLARARSAIRRDAVWYKRAAPPSALSEAFPGLFPPA